MAAGLMASKIPRSAHVTISVVAGATRADILVIAISFSVWHQPVVLPHLFQVHNLAGYYYPRLA